MKNILYTIILSFLFSYHVFADYEVLDVCATYSNSGKSYKVEAKIFSGRELNRRTRTFKYSSFSTYAIIFWSNDQATVIKLGNVIGGRISEIGSNTGVDQQGRPWSIKKGHRFCY